MGRPLVGLTLAVCLVGPSCASRLSDASPPVDRESRKRAAVPGESDGDEGGPARPDHAWFTRQRMSAGEPIPPRVRERALERHAERGRRSDPELSAAPATAPGEWEFAGPLNVGGRLTALAVDPHDTNHLWAGAAAGGVFESVDGGTTWSPVFDDQPLLSVGAIVAHPADSSIVYVGAGEANGAGYSYDGDGVYRTTDGGATWQHLGLDATRRIGRIAIDPLDPDRIFVAAAGGVYVPDANRGVYRSTDGGATWTQVLFVANTAGAIDVAIDPADPDRIFAALWDHHCTGTTWVAGGLHSGVWLSTDGGDSWARLGGGLPAASPTVGRIGLALAPSDPQVVYALYLNDPGALIGVYRSLDGGASWARVDAPGELQVTFAGFGYYFGQIRVDPLDPLRVWVLDVYMAWSADGGVTWTNILTGLHVDHHDLAILPGRLLLANDAGFYRSTDGGVTWTQASSLPVSQFYDLGINPSNPLIRFGGLQDNGTVRTRTGGLADWQTLRSGDGMHCEVDPTDGRKVYCASSNGGIARSTNGGNTFSTATTGIPPDDRRNWSVPLVHDPATSQRLYTGTYRVFRSTDGASTWSPISGDLTGGPALQAAARRPPATDRADHLASVVERTLTTLAVSPVDTGVIWAGTDDGHVWVRPGSAASWTPVDVPGRTEWVTRVEADPSDASAAYVTFSGYRSGSSLPRIFRTMDDGSTWIDISAGLPDVPLNCVNADPDPPARGRLFVCSDLGVHVSSDLGRSWSWLGTGMPRVVVHDLDLMHSTRELFAGTHGRSMYRYDLGQLGPADYDGDGADNLADCAAEDPGAFAVPAEVAGLELMADRVTIRWDSAAPAAGTGTLHQVLRGAIDALPPAGGAAEVCLAAGTPLTSQADTAIPPIGSGFWYLVRGVNACGAGSYGAGSNGQPRASDACP